MIRFESVTGNYYYLVDNPYGFGWVSSPKNAKRLTRHQARKASARLLRALLSVTPEVIREKS